VTGFDRLAAIAMRSENQYIAKLNTSAIPRNNRAPRRPPTADPTTTNRPPRAAMRTQVFTRLIPVISLLLQRKRPSPTNSAKVSRGVIPPGPEVHADRVDGLSAWATT